MENRNGDRVVPIPAEGPGQRPSPHSRFVTIVPNFTGLSTDQLDLCPSRQHKKRRTLAGKGTLSSWIHVVFVFTVVVSLTARPSFAYFCLGPRSDSVPPNGGT
ncbi:hypothetical protein HYQ46_000391 [Verticillium longisporum]|nr:hypothetical protein HYQ46_000391 [Verticillium longisporum]